MSIALSGCSTMRPWDHTNPPLSLEIVPAKLSLKVGETFPVSFILTNTSSRPIEACFGSPWHYTMLADHFPLESQGNIKTANIHGMSWIVDHPSCVEKRFRLDPNETKEWSEQFTALDVQYNKVKLAASITVVDPNDCHEVYGCDEMHVYTDWIHVELVK